MARPLPATDPQRGLEGAEAARRLAQHGPNALPQAPRRGPLRILGSVLGEPMFLLLVLAALLYLAVGSLHEGLLLGAFAALTVALVVVQEARSERALEALRQLGAPLARVRRDGRVQRIAASDVVPGDLLLVDEGERIAADGALLAAEGLQVDESLLTGESVPVDKLAVDHASAEQRRVSAGTLVVRGHGLLQVDATGAATATGRIGTSLADIDTAPSPLQATVARLVRLFGFSALAASLGLVLLHGLLRGEWLAGALAGIALAMALLPEEFPMVLTVFLALGAWRLARRRVLVRRTAVVETLGAASLLCVDKTGTLTENRMRVRCLVADGARLDLDGSEAELPEPFHRLLEYALLASRRSAFDPMDAALGRLGEHTLAGTEHLHADWPLEREYGLTPQTLALSRVWRGDDGRGVAATKGAPEAVATLCDLDAAARLRMLEEVEVLAAAGLRVLAVAGAELSDAADLPAQAQALPFAFVGLVAFQDPLRAGAAAAVAEARAAGIGVAMITGDYPATAAAIAREAGIDLGGGVLDGPAIDRLDDTALAQALRHVRVFARVRPEQKLRLVQAFRADGEVVAMTGDGVNDAPALKAAHIGLAMGARGTDVAREAAGIVLLDDDLAHLVGGVRLGRRIFDNLRKAMMYIAAIHVPIAGLALLPLLFGLPPLLLPPHVVLIEMVIDPICSVAFEAEPEEAGLMRRPPRRAEEPLIGRSQLGLAAVQGLLLLAVVLGVQFAATALGQSAEVARSLAFLTLTAGNLMLVRVSGASGATLPRLFERGHAAYWIVAALASAIIGLCLLLPPLARLFGFDAPAPLAALLAVLAGLAATLAFDLLKPLPAVRRRLGGAAG